MPDDFLDFLFSLRLSGPLVSVDRWNGPMSARLGRTLQDAPAADGKEGSDEAKPPQEGRKVTRQDVLF